MTLRHGLMAFGAFMLFAGAAPAQLLSIGGGSPIEIEASDSLEWLSEQQAYVARGNALVRQGDTSLRASVITAYYRDAAGGGTEVFRVVADGGVVVRTPTEQAEGARGVYDFDADTFVLSGGDVRLVTPDETITATESLEYHQGDGLAVARGDALIVRGTDELQADVVTARFAENEAGERDLSVVNAEGDVQITTPTETARGAFGVYDVAAQLATLGGGVRLTRGESQFNGDRVEVNLATGISRLLGPADGDGRVRALLAPGGGD